MNRNQPYRDLRWPIRALPLALRCILGVRPCCQGGATHRLELQGSIWAPDQSACIVQYRTRHHPLVGHSIVSSQATAGSILLPILPDHAQSAGEPPLHHGNLVGRRKRHLAEPASQPVSYGIAREKDWFHGNQGDRKRSDQPVEPLDRYFGSSYETSLHHPPIQRLDLGPP